MWTERGRNPWVEIISASKKEPLEDRVSVNEDNIQEIARSVKELRNEVNVLKIKYDENSTPGSNNLELEYSEEELMACESICLKEIEVSEKPLYPSDIARKYDLDVVLVNYSLGKLAREGKIIEATDPYEYKNNV